AWSPDGGQIAYVDRSTIVVVNGDGTRAARSVSSGTLPASSPAWSRDSSKIAFMRGYAPDESLWVVNADGSAQRRLGSGEWGSPQWAPGGGSIVVGDFQELLWPSDSKIRLVSSVDGKATALAPIRRSPVEIRNARTV